MNNIFQIDIGIQGNAYVFRINPKTKKDLPIDNFAPAFMSLSYDSNLSFDTVYENPFIACIHNHLSNLDDENLVKLGFATISFYDCKMRKDLKRCPLIKKKEI